jgi:hypothetical protein
MAVLIRGTRASLIGAKQPLTLDEERSLFYSRVLVGEPSQCWPMVRIKDRVPVTGYGTHYSPTFGAIRGTLLSVMLDGRFCSRSDVVMHLCDNPPCVNPHHLRVASQSENMIDHHQKGRHNRRPEKERIVERLRQRSSPRLATLGPEWFA